MTFVDPTLLLIGLVLTALVLVGLHSYGRRRRVLADFLGGGRALARLSRKDLSRLGIRRTVLLGLAGAALATAAAEPRPVDEPEPTPPVHRTILAVDVSASMQAEDETPTRLAAGVRAAQALLDSLPDSEVGLLAFSGTPYPLAPPTRDHDAIRYLLGGMAPRLASAQDPGTVISSAILEALDLFERQAPDAPPSEERVEERTLVVISDGDSAEPDDGLDEAIAVALEAGVAIHVVGVGTEAGSGMSMPSGTYQLGGPVVTASGTPAISRIGEPLLRTVASDGTGAYAHAGDAPALAAMAGRLGRPTPSSEPTSQEVAPFWDRYDLSFLLGSFGLALILLESLMGIRLTFPTTTRVLPREAS